MIFQWYPGHMTKAKRAMQEDIKYVDLVIELLDARIPMASRNPDINELAKNKSRVVILNKADLADPEKNEIWKSRLTKEGVFACLMDSRSRNGMKNVSDIIEKACEKKFERDRKRGILRRPVRAMIVGIPNVGKSTFINSYAKKACAKTGNKPGVTKGKQWVKLSKDVELLDTPGILWPKFEDQQVGLRLALIGSIKDEILNTEELATELIRFFDRAYPQLLEKDQQAAGSKDPFVVLESYARRRNCLGKGGALDTEKAALLLLEEFRNGRLGRITLEE